MTDCTTEPLLFSSLQRQKIQADFAGGTLTTDAGLLALREVNRRLGLIEAIDAAIADPRDPLRIQHEQRTLLAQRIYGIAAGYEDLNDQQTLRFDPVLAILAEQAPDPEAPLASAPTLCRLENRLSRADLWRIARIFVEQFLASQKTPPAELILDFDATDARLHGNQQGAFFHAYYGDYCYLPLYVFCGSQLLAAYLRPANIDGALHAWAILKLLVQRLRQAWPEVRIIFRGDSGFCRWKMLRWCDRHGVGYLVGLARNPVLEGRLAPTMAQATRQFEQSQRKQRIFAEFEYAAATWDRRRRVIGKAEYTAQGPNPRFLVTNLPDGPQSLYDERYCSRGDMENRIKEQQLDLFADRVSCHDFLPNQFRLLLSAAAYVLVETLRRQALAGTELAAAQAGTIRLKLFKVAARVVVSVRRVVLHLASSYPLAGLLRQVVERLRVPAPAAVATG
jgi:hypothetical protein